jgi:hypothetical protein
LIAPDSIGFRPVPDETSVPSACPAVTVPLYILILLLNLKSPLPVNLKTPQLEGLSYQPLTAFFNSPEYEPTSKNSPDLQTTNILLKFLNKLRTVKTH